MLLFHLREKPNHGDNLCRTTYAPNNKYKKNLVILTLNKHKLTKHDLQLRKPTFVC